MIDFLATADSLRRLKPAGCFFTERMLAREFVVLSMGVFGLEEHAASGLASVRDYILAHDPLLSSLGFGHRAEFYGSHIPAHRQDGVSTEGGVER